MVSVIMFVSEWKNENEIKARRKIIRELNKYFKFSSSPTSLKHYINNYPMELQPVICLSVKVRKKSEKVEIAKEYRYFN